MNSRAHAGGAIASAGAYQRPSAPADSRHKGELETARMAKSAQSQKSILIVEDDADIQSLVRRMLALNGYTNYYLAANGEEAIRLLRSNLRPDLIITDRMMPLMDGLEMLREVRCHEELCGIPAIVISALTPESDNAIAALWNDYIVKPLSVQSLLSAVERLIGAP